MDLTEINNPSFIKQLDKEQMKELAEEIRSFLIEKLSVTGGHIGPNLGVVELTLMLHKISTVQKIKFCGMSDTKRMFIKY